MNVKGRDRRAGPAPSKHRAGPHAITEPRGWTTAYCGSGFLPGISLAGLPGQ